MSGSQISELALEVSRAVRCAGGRCSAARLHDLLQDGGLRHCAQRERAIAAAVRSGYVERQGSALQLTSAGGT